MKKTIQKIMFVVFVLVSYLSYGQDNTENVAYMKNGSIIRGDIIENEINQYIKIQTKDGSIFVFKYDEIEKIKIEKSSKENLNNNPDLTSVKKNGFVVSSEIIYSPGYYSKSLKKITSDDNSIGYRCVSGYQFNEHLTLGVGIGIDKFNKVTRMPISLDVKASLLKGKISPVFNVNFGYAIGLIDSQGGVLVNPQIGVKKYISKNTAYLFSIGYKWQETNFVYYYGVYGYYPRYYRDSKKEFVKFLTINTGFVF